MASALTLVVNPGSTSRKYALYHRTECLARLHFEREAGRVICTLWRPSGTTEVGVNIADLADSLELVPDILHHVGLIGSGNRIAHIAVRVVAPNSFFLQDHIIDDAVIEQLEQSLLRAPLHIAGTLSEVRRIRAHFPDVTIVGASDSAFHITKPDYAWNYGLPLQHADLFDIKRFGYHGLSVAAAVHTLRASGKLTPRLVVCHLGGGASVSAVYKGRSMDTTMGYSPLEGVVMATRSGSVDAGAVRELQRCLGLDDDEIELYLNQQSGLLGLSGTSADIKELLQSEQNGDHRAALALATYIFSLQKAIGQMVAVLGGVDALIFTGTVGERSFVVRERVVEKLDYLDFQLDKTANHHCAGPSALTVVSRAVRSKPVIVVPADEAGEIARVAHHITMAR